MIGGTISGSAPDSWTVEITSGTGTLTLTNPARTVAADGDADGEDAAGDFGEARQLAGAAGEDEAAAAHIHHAGGLHDDVADRRDDEGEPPVPDR